MTSSSRPMAIATPLRHRTPVHRSSSVTTLVPSAIPTASTTRMCSGKDRTTMRKPDHSEHDPHDREERENERQPVTECHGSKEPSCEPRAKQAAGKGNATGEYNRKEKVGAGKGPGAGEAEEIDCEQQETSQGSKAHHAESSRPAAAPIARRLRVEPRIDRAHDQVQSIAPAARGRLQQRPHLGLGARPPGPRVEPEQPLHTRA